MEDVIRTLADIEREHIIASLEKLKGDRMKTARVLGIGKTTLYRKLREYNYQYIERSEVS
jgi:DNA-binding NtrC family response regulator